MLEKLQVLEEMRCRRTMFSQSFVLENIKQRDGVLSLLKFLHVGLHFMLADSVLLVCKDLAP